MLTAEILVKPTLYGCYIVNTITGEEYCIDAVEAEEDANITIHDVRHNHPDDFPYDDEYDEPKNLYVHAEGIPYQPFFVAVKVAITQDFFTLLAQDARDAFWAYTRSNYHRAVHKVFPHNGAHWTLHSFTTKAIVYRLGRDNHEVPETNSAG